MILTVTSVGPNTILDARKQAKQLGEDVTIRKGSRPVLTVTPEGDTQEVQAPHLRVMVGEHVAEALLSEFGPRRRAAIKVANRFLNTHIEEIAA